MARSSEIETAGISYIKTDGLPICPSMSVVRPLQSLLQRNELYFGGSSGGERGASGGVNHTEVMACTGGICGADAIAPVGSNAPETPVASDRSA